MLLPPSKLSREMFALFTTIFFAWLVGPSEVRYKLFHYLKDPKLCLCFLVLINGSILNLGTLLKR